MYGLYQALKDLVNNMDLEMVKAEKGNCAAGTRVRKGLQEARNIAKELRNVIIEAQKERKG